MTLEEIIIKLLNLLYDYLTNKFDLLKKQIDSLKITHTNDIKSINEKIKNNHANKDVLDLLTTDGTNLYFNGKNIQKIELPDEQNNYTGTFMNVTNGQTYSIGISSGSKQCDQIVQAWEFEEGGTDLTTVAKSFNNHTDENFYHEDDIEFTDDVCKVKDKYELENILDNTIGLYKTKFNKSDFKELIGFEVNN